jgi:carbohydrate-selective porin OprB
MFATTFLQPTVTFIPTPGAAPNLPAALTMTMRLTVLF